MCNWLAATISEYERNIKFDNSIPVRSMKFHIMVYSLARF